MVHVYLLKAEDRYKIGVAANIGKRIKQLQTGNAYVVELVAYVSLPDRKSACFLERSIHRNLHYRRCEGEWFDLTDQQVDIVKSQLKRTY